MRSHERPRSIGIQNLSERLSVPATGDELARLSETWNAMLARLEAAVKRLTQFTADASHELRTPIALIRTTAELTLRRERSAADVSRGIAANRSRVRPNRPADRGSAFAGARRCRSSRAAARAPGADSTGPRCMRTGPSPGPVAAIGNLHRGARRADLRGSQRSRAKPAAPAFAR